MKTLLHSLWLLLTLTRTLASGIPVVDAAALAQRERHHAEAMLQQRQQTGVLERQFGELRHLNNIIGDPGTVRSLPGFDVLRTPLRLGDVTDPAKPLAAAVAATLADDGRGLFTVVGAQFKSLDGEAVKRLEQTFKPVSAMVDRRKEFEAVAQEVNQRRDQLRSAARQTIEQLRVATTIAETLKCQGVLLGLHLELDATDRDLQFAAQRLQVQAIDNDNADKRQGLARQEEQTDEIRRSLKRLVEGLRPNTKPVQLRQTK
jgi:hypothetical protein